MLSLIIKLYFPIFRNFALVSFHLKQFIMYAMIVKLLIFLFNSSKAIRNLIIYYFYFYFH
jgi:hypothetical protein